MKYDNGQHLQLLVHNEECKVSTVETWKDGNTHRIRIEAVITPALDKAIAGAWNKAQDGLISGAFNGGKAIQTGREEALVLTVDRLELELETVRAMLAQRTLGIVPDLDDDVMADLDEEE